MQLTTPACCNRRSAASFPTIFFKHVYVAFLFSTSNSGIKRMSVEFLVKSPIWSLSETNGHLILFLLSIQGVLSAPYPAVVPAECVAGTEFYSPAHPQFLMYCFKPGVFNVTACLDATFSKVPFNNHLDIAQEKYAHLGFRYKCVLIQEQGQTIATLQYTGCVDMTTKALIGPGKTFVDPATKQTCECHASRYFSCGSTAQ